MTIQEIQDEIIEEFSFFDDWMQRYEYLIELGKSLQPMDESLKNEKNLINGCQSKVWVSAEKKEAKIFYKADSDAIITKGIVALLLRVYSGQKPEDILKTEPEFIHAIGLKENLSPTRANGLYAMIKQIKFYALALQMH